MDNVLEKIRKLLNTAKDAAATPAEAETALRLAIKLQSSNGITDDQILSNIIGAYKKVGILINIDSKAIRQKTIYTTGRMGRWDHWIGIAASIASNTRIIISTEGYREKSIVAYGLPTDLEVCKCLFDYSFDVADRLRKFYCAVKGIDFGGKAGKAWMDGFCLGLQEAARKAIQEQTESKENLQITTNTGALVLVQSNQLSMARNRAIAQFERQTYPNLRSAKSFEIRGGTSYEHGRATGSSQNLSRNTING
jgi:hypothetical protein